MRRRLVDVYGRILGPTNRRTLQARLAVVGSLLAQGHYLKAQAENQTLRSSILELFENGHPLTVSANYTYAKICTASGRTEETERYYRQHLQTMLSLHGPRAIQTVTAMLWLGGEISRRIPKEADILLRIAGQLSIELPPVDENPCRSLRFVISKLLGLGAYEESYCMATKLVERYSLPLGDQHPALWKAREKLAWSMRALGDLQKSITIFRAAISHQEERALGFDHSHVNSWCGLADLLSQTGEIEEATMWYKKTFEARTAFYGGYNYFTLSTAYCLGYCYYKQCRYDEALNLYGKMVQRLYESGQGGRAIRDFESYILHIHRKIDEKKEVEGFREL
jgi:tetratricopeptide (TPR) repeat protein